MSLAAQKAWKSNRRAQKYNNERVVTEDGAFDSKREHKRWCELKLLERAGAIRNLEHHVDFKFEHNGVAIGKYEADFVYFEGEQRICEDSKGVQTDVFKIKARLMRAFYGIEIRIT